MDSLKNNLMRTNSEMPVRVIAPHNGLDAFRDCFNALLRDWSFTKYLAWRIFVRDTQAMFRMNFLGYAWLVLPALANTFIWVFLSSSSVIKIDSGEVPYPLFVFVGTWLWTAFNNCLLSGLGLIDEARATLAKVNYPIESNLIAGFGKNILIVAVTGLGLIPLAFLYPSVFSAASLLFPLALLFVMVFGTAIGLLFVPIAALVPDLTKAIHLALRFAFFLTPVIYPMPLQGRARNIMLFNPISAMIDTPRWLLIGGNQSTLTYFITLSLVGLILLLLSLVLTKVALPHILERIHGN